MSWQPTLVSALGAPNKVPESCTIVLSPHGRLQELTIPLHWTLHHLPSSTIIYLYWHHVRVPLGLFHLVASCHCLSASSLATRKLNTKGEQWFAYKRWLADQCCSNRLHQLQLRSCGDMARASAQMLNVFEQTYIESVVEKRTKHLVEQKTETCRTMIKHEEHLKTSERHTFSSSTGCSKYQTFPPGPAMESRLAGSQPLPRKRSTVNHQLHRCVIREQLVPRISV